MTGQDTFKNSEDIRKRNCFLGLAYGSYLPFVFLAQTLLSPLEYAVKFAFVSALSVLPDFLGGGRGKGLLSGLFNKKAFPADIAPAPQNIAGDVETLRLKAGLLKRIPAYLYGGDDTVNAGTGNGRIYVGRGLFNMLSRAEMKTVLAHEIAHIKAEDTADGVLFRPAKLNAVADFLIGATTLVTGAASAGLKGIAAPLLTLLIARIFCEFQDMLDKANQRMQEYRADRNAFKLTDDFRSAARAFVKMNPAYCSEAHWLVQAFSTHPRGIDRLRAIERAANGGAPTHFSEALLGLAGPLPSADPAAAPDREILVDVAWELTDGGKKPYVLQQRM